MRVSVKHQLLFVPFYTALENNYFSTTIFRGFGWRICQLRENWLSIIMGIQVLRGSTKDKKNKKESLLEERKEK